MLIRRLILTLGVLWGGQSVEAASPCEAADWEAGETGLVVLVNKGDDTVSVLDSENGHALGTIPTGSHPHEIALSPDGATAYVSIYGSGPYGGNKEPGDTLAVIDLKAMTESRIDLAPHKGPHGLAVDAGGRVWVTAENDAMVLVVDPKERRIVDEVPTGSTGSHWIVLRPDGTKAYTSNKQDPSLTVIDVASRKKVGAIPVPNGAEGLGVSPDGRRVYAGDLKEPRLFVIDTETDQVVKTVPLASRPGRVRVSPDNKNVVVSSYDPGTVEVVDTERLESRGVIKVGKRPMSISFDSGGRAFVSNSAEPSLSVIDLRKLKVLRSFRTGKGPDGVAYAPRS